MKNLFTISVFFLIFIVGLLFFRDFGISWDEPDSRKRGLRTMQFITGENRDLLKNVTRYHGPAFELIQAYIEKTLYADHDIQKIYHIRHLANFILFFTSCIFFYLICSRLFSDTLISITGVLIYVLNPRIFGHAFFNPKDIPFMAVFVIAIYTLLIFISKKSLLTALIHSITCAFLIDIRLVGVMVPIITFIILIFIHVSRRRLVFHDLEIYAAYFFSTIFFTVLFWPVLWKSPYSRMISILSLAENYNIWPVMLFMGKALPASEAPWYYIPVWIGITVPVIYTLLSILGFASGFPRTTPQRKEKFEVFLVYLWLVIPIMFLIISDFPIYDSWRQLFFIYPAMVLFSLSGIEFLRNRCAGLGMTTRKFTSALLLFILIINFANIIYQIHRLHPLANLYQPKFKNAVWASVSGSF